MKKGHEYVRELALLVRNRDTIVHCLCMIYRLTACHITIEHSRYENDDTME